MKNTASNAVPSCCINGQLWSPELFEEITDLLAEALYKDYQEHRRATVNSPPGFNQTIALTARSQEIK